jgi:hypothetical protein
MTDHLPYVWRKTYRTGLEKITGYDLQGAHEKARQYLATARTKKPRRPTAGTK